MVEPREPGARLTPAEIDALPLLARVPVRAVDLVTRPPVLRWLAPLYLLANALVVGVYLATLTGPTDGSGEVVVGDFAAFWTGAELLADGRGPELYAEGAQREMQAEILGRPLGERWQPYLNPPGLALALSALRPLGLLHAFYAWDLAGLAALAVGFMALRPTLPRTLPARADAVTAAAVILAFPAILRPLAGGQNTAVTLGLASAAYGWLARGWDVPAGVAVGLLSYKPQYGLPLGVALLLWRRWRAAGAAAAIAAAHYGLAAWWCGAAWPMRYLAALRVNEAQDRIWNGPWHFSWPAVVTHVAPAVAPVLAPLGVAVILGLTGRRIVAEPPGSARFPLAFAAALTAAMLVSSHLWYYEVGLLVLPVLLWLESRPAPPGLGVRAALVVAFFGTGIYELGPVIGVQPLFFALVGMCVLTWGRTRTR